MTTRPLARRTTGRRTAPAATPRPPARPDAPPTMTLTIAVTGVNPAPQGSKDFKGFRTDKTTGKRKAVLVESAAERLKPWREAVTTFTRSGLARQGNPPAMDGVIRAEIILCLKPPKNRPKTLQDWPNTLPYGDIDKLVRSTFDSLKTGGAIVDDARICDLRVVKLFAGEDGALAVPGAVVRLTRLDLDREGNKIKRQRPLDANQPAEVTA